MKGVVGSCFFLGLEWGIYLLVEQSEYFIFVNWAILCMNSFMLFFFITFLRGVGLTFWFQSEQITSFAFHTNTVGLGSV